MSSTADAKPMTTAERLSRRKRGGASGELHDPHVLPAPPIRWAFYLFAFATAFVILSLTAYTHSLDDIKHLALHIGGGALLCVWLLLWTLDKVQPLPRIIWVPYVLYLVANLASTLVAAPEAKWVGWQYVSYYTCTFGFVLVGASVVTTKKMVELSLKFWVVITLLTTGFGLIHYSTLLESIYALLYGGDSAAPVTRFQALLFTFIKSPSMLSTILNTQFFGVFLLMVLPVTVACGLFVFRNLQRRLHNNEPYLRPLVWTVLSGLAVVFSITCVFTTYSKSAIGPLVLVLLVMGTYLLVTLRRIPYLGLMIALGLVMGGTILYFIRADLQAQLVNIEDSTGPRRIMFAGAWDMFREAPIWGMGPGSFRIYFANFRSPDYHLTRISNVTLYSHNWLLDLLAETGLAGTLSYCAFLLGLAWLGFRVLRTCPDRVLRVAVFGCLLGIVSLLLGSALNPMSRWPVGTVSLHAMISTALGIIVFSLRNPDEEAEPQHAPSRAPIPLRVVLLGAAVIFSVRASGRALDSFNASYEHNEGLRYAESIPASMLASDNPETQRLVERYFEESIRHFKASLALDPARPTTYYKMAHSYNRLGMTEEALATYHELQKYVPDYSEIHFNLAVIYYNLAVQESEKEAAERQRGNREAADAARQRMLDYFTLSTREFDRQAELSNKVSVWFFRARTYRLFAEQHPSGSAEATELYAKAGEAFERTAFLPISTVIQEEGQEAKEADQRLRALLSASESYALAGNPAKAAQMAEKYLEEIPTSLTSLRMAVEGYLQAEQPGEAIRVLDSALARNPLSPDLHLLKFDALRKLGDSEAAAEQGRFLLLLNHELKAKGASFLPAERVKELRTQLEKISAVDRS